MIGVRCISRKIGKNKIKGVLIALLGFLCVTGTGCESQETVQYATEYSLQQYNQSLYQGTFFAENLCVTNTEVPMIGYEGDASLHAAGLFDVNGAKVVYAQNLFQKIYPASTTKVLTAYVVMKYADLNAMVTVSENAVNLEAEAQMCGLQPGDQLTVNDLLNGLVLHSGNDAAVALAEHISGSVEAFAELMNKEAAALGATHTHFTNPHGLHEADHYTTAYDLYLMFNACIQDQRFIDIISQPSYTATLHGGDGIDRTVVWEPSNFYSLGAVEQPAGGMHVFGGKTGTTDEAGSCVILYNQKADGSPYISIIMGAPDKITLYSDMTQLLDAGVTQ